MNSLSRLSSVACNSGSGIYLSGGLDSVSIAALAAEKSRQTRTAAPRALSVSFPHPDCNEAQIQTAVAAQLGLPIHLDSV